MNIERRLKEFANGLDDCQMRAEYPVLYSEAAISEELVGGLCKVKWTVWCVDESNYNNLFDIIRIPKSVIVEHKNFHISTENIQALPEIMWVHSRVEWWKYVEEDDFTFDYSDCEFQDIDDLRPIVLESYIDRFRGVDLWLKVEEWFDEDQVDYNAFHPKLRELLDRSRDDCFAWREEKKRNYQMVAQTEGSTEEQICPACEQQFDRDWQGFEVHWNTEHGRIIPYPKAWQFIQSGLAPPQAGRENLDKGTSIFDHFCWQVALAAA